MARKYTWFGGMLAFWLAFDQITKEWTRQTLVPGRDEVQIIPGLLSFVHAQNTGAAFSSLDGAYWLFIGFTVVATVVIFDLLRRMRGDDAMMAGTMGMILSGAWGNGLDRLRIGHVTDFIRVYTDAPGPKKWLIENFGTNTWPIFNIADSALLVGVSIFLVHYLFLEESEDTDGEAAAAEER